jgi:hypothetical protein
VTIHELIQECTERGQLNEAWFIPRLTDIIEKEVIGGTPKGHIEDEECCDVCDLRAEQRKKLKELK